MQIWKKIEKINYKNTNVLLESFKKKILKQVRGLIIFSAKIIIHLKALNYQ